jgi:hypothetical protein
MCHYMPNHLIGRQIFAFLTKQKRTIALGLAIRDFIHASLIEKYSS